MFPGTTTKLSEAVVASAATVEVKTDMVRVTGTTSISSIAPVHYGGGFSGILFIVPVDGDVATLTTGNISLAVTMPQSRVTVLVYNHVTNTWYPGAIS